MPIRPQQKEIEQWEAWVCHAGNPQLIQQFYTKIGQEEKIKPAIIAAATKLAEYDCLFDKAVKEGRYSGFLTEEEIKKTARRAIRNIKRDSDISEFLGVLSFETYRTAMNEEDLKKVVSKITHSLDKHFQYKKKYEQIASNFFTRSDSLCDAEDKVNLYYVFEEYKKYMSLEQAIQIITLAIVHKLFYGRVEEAVAIKDKYPEQYNEPLAITLLPALLSYGLEKAADPNMIQSIYTQTEIKEMYAAADRDEAEGKKEYGMEMLREKANIIVLEHLVSLHRSTFSNLFETVEHPLIREARTIIDCVDNNGNTSDKKTDERVLQFRNRNVKRAYAEKKCLPYPTREEEVIERLESLKKKENITVFDFPELVHILENPLYREALQQERMQKMLQEVITIYKEKLSENDITIIRDDATIIREIYLTKRSVEGKVREIVLELFPRKAEIIDIKPKYTRRYLLDEKESMGNDTFSFLSKKIDRMYNKFIALRNNGQELPEEETIRDLIFLEIVAHAKSYPGKEETPEQLEQVFTDPKNKPYINNREIKRLFSKIMTEHYTRFCKGGFDGKPKTQGPTEDHFAFLYALAGSSLRPVIKDITGMKPYVRLHQFLEQ